MEETVEGEGINKGARWVLSFCQRGDVVVLQASP